MTHEEMKLDMLVAELDYENRLLRARNERLEKEAEQRPSGWRPIETAPKDGTEVLVMYMHIDTQVVHNGFWIGTDETDEESEIGWWSYEHSEVSRIKLNAWWTPTHWMPLPPAP